MNVQETLLREKIDPALTDDALSALVSRALNETTRVHGYEVLTGGCWNRVIGVDAGGRDLVIKISPHENDRKITREFDVLESFNRLAEMPVPRPLLLEPSNGTVPGTTLVMTRLPGAVMHSCFGRLREPDRRRITTEIAEHVASLHQTVGAGFGGVELEAEARLDSWPEFWLPRFDTVLDDVQTSGVVPQELIDGAREIRPDLEAPLRSVSTPVLCHYDIWSGNVMIDLDADPPRVSGYIDIPGYYADYARELSFALLFGVADAVFFEVYTRDHAIDDGFELRVAIYNLKMNLRHIQMYPQQWYYQAGAAQCLETIRKYLAGL